MKGGVGWILEYFGEGVSTLTVPQRATITNMGTETGAFTYIFPTDGMTRDYLARQGRGNLFRELPAGARGDFHRVLEIDLGGIAPMVALPSSPGNVVTVEEAG